MYKSKKNGKKIVKKIGKGIKDYRQKSIERRKKREAYMRSPEYKEKLMKERERKLADMDYQIKLEKKRKELNKARGKSSKGYGKTTPKGIGGMRASDYSFAIDEKQFY